MMREVTEFAKEYFRPPVNSFWIWEEETAVITWSDGKTICYRDDLVPVLLKMAETGIPPMTTMLLLMLSCTSDWKDNEPGKESLTTIGKRLLIVQHSVHSVTMATAIMFTDVISQLPVDLRTGDARVRLFSLVCEDIGQKWSTHQRLAAIRVFNSGALDETVLTTPDGAITRGDFLADLEILAQAYTKYPNAEVLETKLRTGVTEVPEPLPIDDIEQEDVDLLTDLAEDSRTYGMARLTHRLVAALNIPMHSTGVSDQSFGGVSDITNRGDYDRLLISELANDDDALMARLANNEALFLRREDLPTNLDLQRRILIDSTIKMWGIPRVFAVSAALACVRNNKQNSSIATYSLAGTAYETVSLEDKEGVVKTLERLDAAMHCGEGLEAALRANPSDATTENILITARELLDVIDFQVKLALAAPSLSFLIALDRDGTMDFYQFNRGGRKLLSSTKFDLDELLFAPPKFNVKTPRTKDELPAFWSANGFPLFFPTAGMRMSTKNTLDAGSKGVLGVNDVQRVLYWPQRTTGAIEAVACIEEGTYRFHHIKGMVFLILVGNASKKLVKLYRIDVENNDVTQHDLSEQMSFWTKAGFSQEECFLTDGAEVMSVDMTTGAVNWKRPYLEAHFHLEDQVQSSNYGRFGHLKDFINNGYSTLLRVRSIGRTVGGRLGIDKRMLKVGQEDDLQWIESRSRHETAIPTKMVLDDRKQTENPLVIENHWLSTSGIEAIMDSRGLLTLRTPDDSLPEVTIIIVVGKATACWASDGVKCGPFYFTGGDGEIIGGALFYDKYIQPYLDQLD
jgi:hypothetical protein